MGGLTIFLLENVQGRRFLIGTLCILGFFFFHLYYGLREEE